MSVHIVLSDVLDRHPERYTCRLCAFKNCLYANARDNKPCNKFEMTQADMDFYRRRDAEDERRRQNEVDREKYALVPCPFCGGNVHFEINPAWVPNYCVSCDDEDCRGHKYADFGDPESKEEAARLWNRCAGRKDAK